MKATLARSLREFDRSILSYEGAKTLFRSFVCAHLTAHAHNLARRIEDYHHLVRCLIFPPLPSSKNSSPTTIYSTSHLFFLGDLNFRLALPESHPLSAITHPELASALTSEATREEMKEFDQLHVERRKGNVFVGLREGEFWKFKCSYKYHLGEVDKYRFVWLYHLPSNMLKYHQRTTDSFLDG
jgi:hypothetical protein